MRLHSLQTGVADRQAGRFLDASGSALPTGRRCSSRRASSPLPPGRVGFSAEPCQHALGDCQLSELIPEPGPFCIEPREPFGNPLLLLSNLVHRSHLLYPSSSLDTEDDVIALVFPMEKYTSCSDDYRSEPLSLSAGIADNLAPIFLNIKCSILSVAHAKYAGAVSRVVVSTTVSRLRGPTVRTFSSASESA